MCGRGDKKYPESVLRNLKSFCIGSGIRLYRKKHETSCTWFSSVIRTSPRAETLQPCQPAHPHFKPENLLPASPVQSSPEPERRAAQQGKPGWNSSRSHWVGGVAGLQTTTCLILHLASISPLRMSSDTYVSKI